MFPLHSYSSCYGPYLAATCHSSLPLAIFHWNPTIENAWILYILKFPVVRVCRFPFIHNTCNISFTLLLFMLCSISCCHLPLILATCDISLKNLPVKMLEFYYLSQFRVVQVYSFPYIHTTCNISFNFLLFILSPITCCHLSKFPVTCHISLVPLPLKMVVYYYLPQFPCSVWLPLPIYSYHW